MGHAGGDGARAFDAAELELSPEMLVTAGKGKGSDLGKGASTGNAAGKGARAFGVAEVEAVPGTLVTAGNGGRAGVPAARAVDVAESLEFVAAAGESKASGEGDGRK